MPGPKAPFGLSEVEAQASRLPFDFAQGERAFSYPSASFTVSIATKVDVLATCGRLEIFSPSTMR